jgi:pimeloyl-ACP methyl ester carboxylesterase
MPYANVNDVQLYYEESGEGEPLVLVHGGWGDHHNWDLVVPALAESFRVITYDRRGHSLSERPATQGSRREDEDDLAALIERLDAAPAHLVGNSWGASTVLGLAARRPSLARSVAAHEPPLISLVAGDPELEPLVREVAAATQCVVARLERGDIEGGTRLFMEDVALGPGGWALLPPDIREISLNNAPTFVDDMGDPAWGEIDVAGLSRLSVPVLMSQGDASPGWFFGIVAALARILPDVEVHSFGGAGHAPHLTHPEPYVDVVSGFAQRHRAQRTAAVGAR